jgi:ABC-type antimicrobial peptide transport system permease subunit
MSKRTSFTARVSGSGDDEARHDAAGANALGYALASRIVNVGYTFSPTVWAVGIACSIVGIAAAGYLGTRQVLRISPLRVLRQLS